MQQNGSPQHIGTHVYAYSVSNGAKVKATSAHKYLVIALADPNTPTHYYKYKDPDPKTICRSIHVIKRDNIDKVALL